MDAAGARLRSPRSTFSVTCAAVPVTSGTNGRPTAQVWHSTLSCSSSFEPVTNDERPSSLLNLRTRRVCEPCNIGWMHRLEDQAKPLLEDAAESGGQLELSRADALVVARWALKTAVTHELTNDRPKVADVQIGARLRTGKPVRGSATLATSVPTHT